MKDSRMMDFIRERRSEAALDLRRSCESVAETEIFQGMDEDTLFDLIKDADRLIVYALDLIAAKRLASPSMLSAICKVTRKYFQRHYLLLTGVCHCVMTYITPKP